MRNVISIAPMSQTVTVAAAALHPGVQLASFLLTTCGGHCIISRGLQKYCIQAFERQIIVFRLALVEERGSGERHPQCIK
jgi:hypothetical protein